MAVVSNQDIALELGDLEAPVRFEGLFGGKGAVHVEVGSGKGTFLLNQARLHPELNYLGIEWANKYYRASVDRMRRWGMTNVRVLRTDAQDFIGRFLADESVATFHVYFPDPWPKKRHHRRRFFNAGNLAQVARCLVVGGELRTATDHAEYFEVMQQVVADGVAKGLFEEVDFCATDAAEEGEWVGSNFERKYVKEGRRIYRLAVRKTGIGK